MVDYISKRQNAVLEAPPDELNQMLENVDTEFGTDWLAVNGDNPVQQLWNRKDGLATNELLTLGEAIGNLKNLDLTWTRQQIARMKDTDVGTRSGATFEILGLNLFSAPTQTVQPAPNDHPGSDGRIIFADRSSMLLSIKNHGITAAEREFKAQAAAAKEEFVRKLREHAKNGLNHRIIALSHPTRTDWELLRDRMDAIMDGSIRLNDTGVWSGRLDPIRAPYLPLSDQHLSYTFVLAAPHHSNEQTNFFDNIRKGIANLAKHHSRVESNVCRALLLRMSETASLPDCETWARSYFADYPDTPVEVIFLYQVAVGQDQSNNTNFIAHHFVPVMGPNYARWQAGIRARRMIIRPLIGRVIAQPTRLLMPNGTTITGHYLFQQGEIFPFHERGTGPINVNASSPAPGISINPVIEDLGALGLIQPPEMRLTLLP